MQGASNMTMARLECYSKLLRGGDDLRRPPHDGEPGSAPHEQRREPGVEKGELDAERDRDGKAAERTADQRLEPAREQPARPVEEQEGRKQRRERQQQAGNDAHRGEGRDRRDEENHPRAPQREIIEADKGRRDRKSGGEGKSVSRRVEFGG